MIRHAPRCLLRPPIPPPRSASTRRFLSTAPPTRKSRSWKNTVTRLGLAAAAIYYYNTSTLFAEEPPFAVPPPSSPSDETALPTLESVKPNRQSNSPRTTLAPGSADPEYLGEKEEEASQEGAFNEETGEINWDCPCLGGMAHGPCGEQFRAAFSCFVFSKEEPKGMDCIDNFKTMQDCFRQHPDIYGSELEDDSEEQQQPDGEEATAPDTTPAPLIPDSSHELIPPAATSATSNPPSPPPDPSSSDAGSSDTERARAAKQQVERDHGEPRSESDELVPKAAHDATGAVPADGGK